LRNISIGVSNIHKPTTTRDNRESLVFRTNGNWVDEASWRKEGNIGSCNFLEANINWTTEGVCRNGNFEVGRGILHIKGDDRVNGFLLNGGHLNVTCVAVQLQTTIVAKISGTADTISLGSSIIDCDSAGTIVRAARYGITWASADSVTISVAVNTVFSSSNVTNAVTTSLSAGNNFSRS
jgi:hypothetical protein